MRPARILVATENPDSGRSLQTSLIRAGYSVPTVASSGREALDLILHSVPRLALLSFSLPGLPDAMETARRIRQVLHIPLIFLAPEGTDLSLNRARVPWATGYLVLPVAESSLLTAVSDALSHSSTSSAESRRNHILGQILAALPDGVITTDLAGLITSVNPRAATILRRPPGELSGQPLDSIIAAAPLDASLSTLPLEQTGGGFSGSLHLLSTAPATTLSSPTDFAALAETISDPLLTLSPAHHVLHLNEAAASLLGAPREQIPGSSLWDYLPATAAAHAADLDLALRDGAPRSFLLHLAPQDTWWQSRVFPLGDKLLLLLQDVTELKVAAAAAERASRLEGLGHLARGFTHDFNNLLTVLMGNLSLARAQAGPGGLRQLLEEAESATRRARDLVEQLTTFAKGGAPIKGLIPLRPLLHEVLSHRSSSSRISCHTHFEGPEFTLHADPKQLRRLLDNLITNAEQAIPETGEVHIRCYLQELDPPSPEPSCLAIEVRDTGCGMAPETVARACEPFFTTRAQSNATGLGLTVCDSIARAHGGSLTLSSQPGRGTIATVLLPLQAPIASSPLDSGTLPHLNGHSRTVPPPPNAASLRRILVLEDESLIRRLIHSTLSQAGFQVDETWDGHQTVEVYRQARDRGQPYDLLIMDLTIENGMGGVEAMHRIRHLDPSALAIVSSGYCDDPAMAQPHDYGFTSVLPKPYQPRHLVEAVEKILAARSTDPPGV